MKKNYKYLFITIVILTTLVLLISTKPTSPGVQERNLIPKTMVREKDGMEMVYIPAGEFTMGSAFLESIVFSNMKLHLFPDQRPQHQVYLNGYWIDKTEVTVGMFKNFVTETGYITSAEKRGGGKPWRDGPKEDEWPIIPGIDWLHPRDVEKDADDIHPVVQVSWVDAMAYAGWVGGTLPTEAQWEKAARGIDARKYPWGNEFNGMYLNYGDSLCPVKRWRDTDYNDGYAFTSPVGIYLEGASPFGVLDMAGNVWEWVYDWYDEDYYEKSPYKNPKGPETGRVKSMRGGSWYDGEPTAWVTCVIRHQNPIHDRYQDVGFRCVINEINNKE